MKCPPVPKLKRGSIRKGMRPSSGTSSQAGTATSLRPMAVAWNCSFQNPVHDSSPHRDTPTSPTPNPDSVTLAAAASASPRVPKNTSTRAASVPSSCQHDGSAPNSARTQSQNPSASAAGTSTLNLMYVLPAMPPAYHAAPPSASPVVHERLHIWESMKIPSFSVISFVLPAPLGARAARPCTQTSGPSKSQKGDRRPPLRNWSLANRQHPPDATGRPSASKRGAIWTAGFM